MLLLSANNNVAEVKNQNLCILSKMLKCNLQENNSTIFKFNIIVCKHEFFKRSEIMEY